MQAYRRPLAPREIDHERLWLSLSLGTFLLLAVWLAARLPTPPCAFHALTGFPCPTCGATRAANQFLHGRFAASFHLNPLAFLSFCAVIVYDIYALIVLTTGTLRVRFGNFSPNEKLLVRGASLLLLAGNWLYLLSARLV